MGSKHTQTRLPGSAESAVAASAPNSTLWMLVASCLPLLLAVLLMLGLSTGCSGPADAEDGSKEEDSASADAKRDGDEDGEDDDDEPTAVPVEAVSLVRGSVESILSFSSNLEAEDHVEVLSEAARRVIEVRVEEGDAVRKGQLLLRLQSDEQQSELAKVEAEFGKAKAEYAQQERLFAEKLISEQDFREFTYNLEQLELRHADAVRELGYTEVRAPISGVVTARKVRLGDHVTVGEHLFDLVDFASLVALVYVPEKHLNDLAPGKSARIAAPSLGDATYSGKIERIAPVVDPQTGTVKVTVAVGRQPGLRPGLYVDVDLVTAVHADAVLIPKRALLYDEDRPFAFRIVSDEEGDLRVERVAVETAVADRDHVVSRSGFDVDDRIVVAGHVGLKDGALIEIPADEPEVGAEDGAVIADADTSGDDAGKDDADAETGTAAP